MKRHTENLLHKIEQKNWGAWLILLASITPTNGAMIAVLRERVRGMFCYFRDVRITIVVGVSNPSLEIPAGFE